MKWALLLWTSLAVGGGLATIEFNSEKDCLEKLQLWEEKTPAYSGGMCIEIAATDSRGEQ